MARQSIVAHTATRWGAVWRRLSPAQLFVGSFLVLVLVGTVGLKVLPGLYTGPELTWQDALFTATSASCVTGLIVVDTATYFTPAGQAFILLLIQLGGLGMFTFTTLIILALGQKLSIRTEALAENTTGTLKDVHYAQLTRDIVLFTFTIELVGALLLFVAWVPDLGLSGALWPAIFHAVSAFCNAGFSTFTLGLIPHNQNPVVLCVVGALIVAGGLGFLTWEELWLWQKGRRQPDVRRFNLSVHSRIVLATTAILIVLGWVAFTLLEWGVTLGGMPVWAKVVNGLFLSITPRTAGFNSIDYAQATDGTNFLTILFMAIGGSPGSTAGGLKTTTVAIIGLLAFARLRGQTIVNLSGRTIPAETVQRSVGLFVLVFGITTAAIMVLTITEIPLRPHREVQESFLAYMFEVVSAFNTVGLSMGTTPELTTAGRWTAILLMFIGRVGPLTFASALARRVRMPSERFRYAYEDVIVG